MEMKLNQVSYTYAGKHQTVHAVDDFSYEFLPGTMYAIVGASGSGKSTLLSLLAGLKQPSSGQILLDGEDMNQMDSSRLRRERILVIYQNFNLFPYLTVEENVLYPLKLQNVDKAEAKRIAQEKLTVVGLKEQLFKRLPAMLSGGEQQRVAVARALASGSEVILADEPTGNLDSENTANIVQILKLLASEENKCVIVVTHDQTVADCADVVLHMRDGALKLPQENVG